MTVWRAGCDPRYLTARGSGAQWGGCDPRGRVGDPGWGWGTVAAAGRADRYLRGARPGAALPARAPPRPREDGRALLFPRAQRGRRFGARVWAAAAGLSGCRGRAPPSAGAVDLHAANGEGRAGGRAGGRKK